MAAAKILRSCYHVAIRRTLFTNAVSSAPVLVRMPALSPTMEEGTLTKWLLAEGDPVEVGDAMCEVETDKAVVTMEATDEGSLAKILVPEGTANVKINVPIAMIAEEDEDISVVANMKLSEHSTERHEISGTPAENVDTHDPVKHKTLSNRALLSPAVKRILEQYNIDARQPPATGPKGILLKGDVLKYITENNIQPRVLESPPPPTPAAVNVKDVQQTDAVVQTPDRRSKKDNFSTIELSNVRKVIAKRLTESKQTVPHSYSSIDCSIGKVLALRRQWMKDGIKLSVNDFIIKAIAVSLRKWPDVNRVWNGDVLENSPTVDISVAVATDGGLITPIVKDAGSKGLQSIADEVRELAGRARAGKLQPHEFQGGSFTISNLGMFGVKEFTAVINLPQTSIMAVGSSRLRPAMPTDAHTDDTSLSSDVTQVMTVTLSSDARVVDSEMAFKFLATFKQNVENPLLMGI